LIIPVMLTTITDLWITVMLMIIVVLLITIMLMITVLLVIMMVLLMMITVLLIIMMVLLSVRLPRPIISNMSATPMNTAHPMCAVALLPVTMDPRRTESLPTRTWTALAATM
jgi:hypothetical protein